MQLMLVSRKQRTPISLVTHWNEFGGLIPFTVEYLTDFTGVSLIRDQNHAQNLLPVTVVILPQQHLDPLLNLISTPGNKPQFRKRSRISLIRSSMSITEHKWRRRKEPHGGSILRGKHPIITNQDLYLSLQYSSHCSGTVCDSSIMGGSVDLFLRLCLDQEKGLSLGWAQLTHIK